MRVLDEAPFVNIFDPEVRADLGTAFAEVRARSAVARTPLGVSVVRRTEVHRLLAEPRLVSAIPRLVGMQEGSHEFVHDLIIAMDGPNHTRLRRLVSPSFTPRAADRHRPVMRTLASALVDEFAPRGRCEFVADFADHYPVQVICEVLGVPREDHDLFARWGEALTYVLSLELGMHLDAVGAAATAMGEYVDGLVADRRARPRDDLVTSLVEASEDGDRLSPAELRAMIAGLLFAGYDTTRNQLGHGLFLFCHHPDQWALLAEHPELAPQAVNEVMRLAGAVAGVPRVAAEAIEVDGWTIPAGTIVFLSVASANRDETVYEDPLTFDISADRPAHLTFGGGPHYCLGANLPRAEMEEALRILPVELPDLHLDGEVVWRVGTAITGPSKLPLAFTPKGSTARSERTPRRR